jgi:CRP/FNR family cyclic AMP-dependent transcriptional regulator
MGQIACRLNRARRSARQAEIRSPRVKEFAIRCENRRLGGGLSLRERVPRSAFPPRHTLAWRVYVEAQAKIADFRYTLQRAVNKVQAPPMLVPDRAAMERFLGACHRRRYPSKTAIIRPGDSANILYYVIDGSLTVSSEDEEGRELILAYLNRGEFIGEMGLFVETPRREVMVRTRTPCELAEIGYERMFNLFEGPLRDECPKILFAIGSQLTNRLLHTSRKVSRLAFMDVTGRVAKTLIDLTDEPDAMTHPSGTQIRISRQEISRIVGCSREMVGRVLKQLEEQGMITVSGKTIVVLGTRGA